MIDDISDLARLDQGQQLKIGCELIQLKDLGKQVFANVDVPSGVEVALELTGGGPPFIHSDPRYLKKILCNLVDHVSNSAVHDYGRTVTLNIGHTADCCVFTVMEAARGALEDSTSTMEVDGGDKVVVGGLPAIFQRYHQELLPEEVNDDFDKAGDQRNKIESEINSLRVNMVGMGLSLSYHLVSALGGDLRYWSRPPDITKFWFSIPHNNGELTSERIVFERNKLRRPSLFIKPEEQSAVQCNQALVASQGLRAMDSPSVLVVEDVPICAKLLCTILRQFKCSAKWVKNGQEAVDLLTKEPDMYNLILMDLRMPVMDGLTATKIIKDKLKMKTPVVALTGEGGDQIREECRLIGFDEYCNKPMKREELLRVIQQHIGYVHQG